MKIKKLINEKNHIQLGAKMVPFAGYNMPIWYSSISEEHNFVRNQVGIFDVSHMGEFIIKGKESKKFLQKVTSNDLDKITQGKIQYSSILNESGGIIDDLLIYNLGNEKYMLVVNASNKSKDIEWLKKHNNLQVTIEDASDYYSLFAIQGPKSIDVVNDIFNKDFFDLKYYNFIKFEDKKFESILISSTGYTGSKGFEIYIKNNFAENFWKESIKLGKRHGIQPIGLGARDTLRLEMGFCLHGNDIDETINPIEAGLGWICKKNFEYIGKNIVDKNRENNPSKTLIGFELKEKGIARKGYKILNKNEVVIGNVTSGTISPYSMKSIGMGYVNFDENKISNSIYIEVRNKKIKAVICKRPFI